MLCKWCGGRIPERRAALGYISCLSCGDLAAKSVRHCVVPMSKSNYIVVSDVSLLRQLNPKRVGG
jgi:hypothetical protein